LFENLIDRKLCFTLPKVNHEVKGQTYKTDGLISINIDCNYVANLLQ